MTWFTRLGEDADKIIIITITTKSKPLLLLVADFRILHNWMEPEPKEVRIYECGHYTRYLPREEG